MKKLTLLSSITLSFALLVSNLSVVNGQENSDQELKEFCRNFPYNEKCKNFHIDNITEFCVSFSQDKRCANEELLVALKNRPGEFFYCFITPNKTIKSRKCKIAVKDQQLLVYLEKGEELEALENQKNTEEVIINLQDVFSFNSPWWIADTGDEKSIGMFADIQVGYLLKNNQKGNKSSFLTISANKRGDDGFSNQNIPKILEKLEPWLYHNPDIAVIAQQLKPNLENSDTRILNNIQKLLDTKECPQCNLTNANLAGADLEGANLEGANLKGADLEGVNLKRSYLVGANLSDAILYKANFENSIMMLSSLENSDLSNSNLQATNLKHSNLNNVDLTKAKLDGNGLNITQLQNSTLENANLTEANIKCANLSSANLTNADLTKTNLEKCEPKTKINRGDISNYVLNKADFNTNLVDAAEIFNVVTSVISAISNPTANLSEAVRTVGNTGVRGLKFVGYTNLSNANLSGANLTKTNLKSADLFNSNLSNAVLNSTNLEDTDLSNSNLIDAKLVDLELEKSFLCNAIMPDFSIDKQGCDDEETSNK